MDTLNNSNSPMVEEKPRNFMTFPWFKLALVLIILGAIILAVGLLTGSRGGRVHFSGGFRIETYPLEDQSHVGFVEFTATEQVREIVVSAVSESVTLVPTSASVPSVTGRDIEITVQNGVMTVSRVGMNIFGGNFRHTRIGIFNFGNTGIAWVRDNNESYLDINYDWRNPFRGINQGGIRVYVPDNVEIVNARSVSGSVRLSDISTSDLTLNATSGSVRVEGGTHNDVTLRSVSGSVRFDGYIGGSLNASSTSGSVNVSDSSRSYGAGETITLRSVSGSVTFTTSAPASNFNYSVSSVSGSMRVDGDRIDGRRGSGGTGSVPVDASTTSGSIRIEFGR